MGDSPLDFIEVLGGRFAIMSVDIGFDRDSNTSGSASMHLLLFVNGVRIG
jgi:hypothetical protein